MTILLIGAAFLAGLILGGILVILFAAMAASSMADQVQAQNDDYMTKWAESGPLT